MSCFVLRVLCIVIGGGGAKEPSLGVCSLGGARIPSRASDYYARGRGGVHLIFFFDCPTNVDSVLLELLAVAGGPALDGCTTWVPATN